MIKNQKMVAEDVVSMSFEINVCYGPRLISPLLEANSHVPLKS